jgi:hypothetical protein
MWLKGDMLCAVSFDRLSLPQDGKDDRGKRIYDLRHLSDEELRQVMSCVLSGLGVES